MSVLGSQLDLIAAEETSRAIRVLLAHPLLTADGDPTEFDLEHGLGVLPGRRVNVSAGLNGITERHICDWSRHRRTGI